MAAFVMGMALALGAALASAPVAAGATELPDTTRSCSLTVSAELDGTSVSGMDFKLWRVGSIGEAGSYELSDAFAGAGVDLSTLAKASDWDGAAKALLAWAEKQGCEPEATAKTSSAGAASFSSLESGLYLVSGGSVTVGGKVYTPTTYLESLPRLIDDAWTYDVSSECKLEVADAPVTPDAETPDAETDDADEEVRKSNERLSQTGDENLSAAQVLPFILAGVVLVVTGLVLWRR